MEPELAGFLTDGDEAERHLFLPGVSRDHGHEHLEVGGDTALLDGSQGDVALRSQSSSGRFQSVRGNAGAVDPGVKKPVKATVVFQVESGRHIFRGEANKIFGGRI